MINDQNITRFSGFADIYDRYRPEPPEILATILLQFAQVDVPELVIDLGSGTGLSTRYWAEKAIQVIGIEPNEDMRNQARGSTPHSNISYQAGYSNTTGLVNGCAPIVTCSQALHWMDPQATFNEVRRILRPGGVFAAFDYDWPPTTPRWEADAAYIECMQTARKIEKALPESRVIRHDKDHHLARMQASRCFRFTKEIALHHVDRGNAERLVGLALSQGGIQTLLKSGYTEADIGIDALRMAANEILGPQPQPWVWTLRVRIGIS